MACTAPIWQSGRTASATIEALTALLERDRARVGFEKTINGNRIRARLVKRPSARADKVTVYVHNPGVNPEEFV